MAVKVQEAVSLKIKGSLYSCLLIACFPSRSRMLDIRKPSRHLETIYGWFPNVKHPTSGRVQQTPTLAHWKWSHAPCLYSKQLKFTIDSSLYYLWFHRVSSYNQTRDTDQTWHVKPSTLLPDIIMWTQNTDKHSIPAVSWTSGVASQWPHRCLAGKSDISHCWFTHKPHSLLVLSLVPGRWLGGAWGRVSSLVPRPNPRGLGTRQTGHS